MARILGIKCKICRREGRKLFLKGKRCLGSKCPIERKGAVPPGTHGQRYKRKLSEFGLQLREKQKVKRIYGVSERQIKKYFNLAKRKTKKLLGKRKEELGTGEILLKLLESRLDNVIFRAGLVPSRLTARQLVSHKQVLVEGKKVNIPSYQMKTGQVVTLSSRGLAVPIIKETLAKKIVPPKWLAKKATAAKVLRLPERKEIDADIDENLIVEFYSR